MEKDLELQSSISWQIDLETQCDDCPNDPASQAMLEDQGCKVNNLCWHLQDRQ